MVIAATLPSVAQQTDQSAPATAPESGQSVTSTPGMPAVKEAGAGSGESGMLSGDKPFTLMVDPEVGELNYVFDEQKNLESIIARRGVVFSSADMTLNSDEFEYKTLNSQLVATGKRVVVRLGEMIVTCQLFKYNPDKQEGEFLGGPVLYNRDATGKTKTTAGRRITFFNVNNKTQMKVEAGSGITPYMRSSPGDAPVPSETVRPVPGQKSATMTMDNNPSPGGSNLSARVTPATNGSPTRQGSLLGLPSTNTANETPAPSRARNNRIDPDNPADVQSVSKKSQ
jgi:hypothetical protein